MWRASGVVVAAVLAGCFQPEPPRGAPCGPNGSCPSGLVCRGGVCGGDAVAVDGGVVPDGRDGVRCGDGRCDGLADELCGSCPSDCATREPVCGNGACDPGEAGVCRADCGPAAWPWLAEETAVVNAINQRRLDGFTCPGGQPQTASALTASMALQPTVHEWVWEIAHHDVFIAGGAACNGRTNADRQLAADFDAYTQTRGAADVTAALAAMFASATTCPLLLSTARTQIAVGVAHDVANGYVVVLE